MHWVLLANAAATIFMTGLIWFVQVVHYPLFAAVGVAEFPAYSRAHQQWTTLVVGPPMLVEALTAALLLGSRPAGVPSWSAWVGLGLVAIIWLSTPYCRFPRTRASSADSTARSQAPWSRRTGSAPPRGLRGRRSSSGWCPGRSKARTARFPA